MNDKTGNRYGSRGPFLGTDEGQGKAQIRIRLTRGGKNLPSRRASSREEASGVGGVPADFGLYVISVAARILEMHPQTLRKYERIGLVTPSRTVGYLRLYSQEDIAKLRLIKHLVDNLGMNLAGVEFALEIVNQFMAIKKQLQEAEAEKLRSFLQDPIKDLLDLLEA